MRWMTHLATFMLGAVCGVAAVFALLAAVADATSGPGPAGDPCHPPECRGCDHCVRP